MMANKMKKMIEDVVGKRGDVLIGGVKYKIEKIDTKGLELKCEFQTIFIPIEAWLDDPIYLPHPDYSKKYKEHMQKEFGEAMEIMMPELVKQTKEALLKELGEGDELKALFGVQAKKSLPEGDLSKNLE